MAVTSIPLLPLVKSQDVPDSAMCLLRNKTTPEILRVQNVLNVQDTAGGEAGLTLPNRTRVGFLRSETFEQNFEG